MENRVRHIHQHFWRGKHFPQLVIRSTQQSFNAYKAHSHAEFSIGMITAGRTCLTIKNENIVLSQGEVVFIEPEEVHACNPISGEARSYYMLYIDNRWCLEQLSRMYGVSVEKFTCHHRVMKDHVLFEKIMRYVELFITHDSLKNAEKLEQELQSLLMSHCSPVFSTRSEHGLACEIQQRLLQDFTQPPLLEALAQELGYSQESVIRTFKRHFGITPKAFLNNRRIEQAKLLLRSGMNIVDVAYEVGFSDQSQLHRAFVNYTASTPKQYKHTASILDNN